ncbi:DUF3618 domain-containing protein [Aeromicrobium sp.]|uniref:DUF3618 domain-containing protein n=1 Tax=Aeromicrobium sp. TaxID=1871063 RepID=UPI003C3E2F38
MTADLEREIDQTREHLAMTVDALAAKAHTARRRAALAVGVGAVVVVVLLVARQLR